MERLTLSKAVLSISKVILPVIYTFLVWVGSLSFAFAKQVEIDIYNAAAYFFLACYIAFSIGYKEWCVKANRKLLFILFHGLPVTLALLFGGSNIIGI